MQLADFVVPEAIISDLRATTKEGAAREMVDASYAAGCVGEADREEIVQAILRREQLGTTGFGEYGVAFPEARHPAVGRTFGTIALSRPGVEFDAMGGGPVHILFLLASPPNRPAEFLHASGIVSRLLHGEDFRNRLRRAGTREEIVGLLAEADRDSLWKADIDAHWEPVRARLREGQPPA
jgi:PTS system fructose-specific IIA component/PTS system nitrogen regulatory IIA component